MTIRIPALSSATALAAITLFTALPPAAAADIAEQIGAQSPWQVRLRALGVVTNDQGSIDQVAGSGLGYGDTVVPELDISYYFTDNVALELILGTTRAGIHGTDSAAALGTVGKTWLLPPTLTLQYHFTQFGAFKPYVGAGVNYTIFYNQAGHGALTDIDVEDSFGLAAQVGFDYMLDEHWGLNLDVKKLFLEPDWSANDGTLTGKAKLDPWLIGTGLTYRF
ncbi:OmpW family protein [Aquibium sp. ELW1220]|uniref:OmpW/AlkL family protein n=1 Tax=Aquibium sp. ELW1220 TaxID=2976766 RepID=UPI0025B1097F|nr:OmpW family protein [Aquibium sp. ELW1220]MDN2581359.1 OmpW family protein [Aquibium sp. ELW1220]